MHNPTPRHWASASQKVPVEGVTMPVYLLMVHTLG